MMTPAKIRQFALFCLAGIAFSSHALAGQPDSQLLLAFQSVGGDAGLIRLEMYENQRFSLQMELIDFNNEEIQLQGDWELDAASGAYHLSFTGCKPFIEALFAEALIVDENTFRLPADGEELWIYHTICRNIST
jgi:hypothetical protein